MKTPAARVLEKFDGDYDKVAKAAGVDISRVHRWDYPKERGGTGGEIPQRNWSNLLENAPAYGVTLTTRDLMPDHLAEHLPETPEHKGLS